MHRVVRVGWARAITSERTMIRFVARRRDVVVALGCGKGWKHTCYGRCRKHDVPLRLEHKTSERPNDQLESLRCDP